MTPICETILLVDDHPPIRKLIRRLCGPAAGEFVEVGSGDEAVAEFERLRPGIVLMDIEMPRMDGLAATRAICRSHPEARIIIVSNHDTPAFRQEAREAGAIGFLSKDDLPQLPSLLRELLGSQD